MREDNRLPSQPKGVYRIQMLLVLKSVYRLLLRALQGFAMSLRRLALSALPVPNCSTPSRRAKALRVTLPVLRNAGKAVHLLVDSAAIAACGACGALAIISPMGGSVH